MTDDTSSVTSAFFKRLNDLSSSLEENLRELESKQIRIRRNLDDDGAAEAAEVKKALFKDSFSWSKNWFSQELLKEVSSLKEGARELNTQVTKGLADMNGFLEDSMNEYQDMKEIVQKYEDYASKFG